MPLIGFNAVTWLDAREKLSVNNFRSAFAVAA